MLGLITARGKSKGIPRKNLHPICGKPLLQYTCEAATRSKLDRTIITTDDPEIAECARKLGVDAPFLRPDELSHDDSPSIDAARHCVEWLNINEDWQPDAVVLLQPTSPLRTHEHIDQAIALFENSGADSLLSVSQVPHNFSPYNVMELHDGWLTSFYKDDVNFDKHRRQDSPVFWGSNGPAILITETTCLVKNGFYGDRLAAYRMNANDSIDIDTIDDLLLAERILNDRANAQ